VRQLKVGLRFRHAFTSKAELSTYGFYSHRNFDGKLPFEFGGMIDLNRNYYGQGSQVTFKSKTNSLQLGYDWAEQRDQRLRYRNLEGVQGDQTLNQLESFSTLGLFVVDHLRLDAFLISLGARYDSNVLKADDDFLDNGDDSGRISLSSFNPSLGVNYKLNTNASLFTSVSTSFETPTLSELSANPTGSGGFNESLKPQKAQNLEAGFRYKNKLCFILKPMTI